MGRRAAGVQASGLWARARPGLGGGKRGAAAGGSERGRPAEQVLAEGVEQETMGGDPTGECEHGDGALEEARRRGGRAKGGERGAKRFGVRAEAAHPGLAALIGRVAGERGGQGKSAEAGG